MIYCFGLISLSLLIFIAWGWRYVIKPFFAKKTLNHYFKNHPEGKRLNKTEKFLKLLYKNTPSAWVSYQERKRLKIDEDAFTYGEIEFLSFFSILDIVQPKSHEIFYDLGSGSGKAIFAVAFYGEIAKCYGIELLPKLHQLANTKIIKAKALSDSLKKISCIEFLNGNFLEHDISNGNIIFINATCLSYAAWENIQKKFLALKAGSRIIVTTKKISDERFKVLHQGMTLMSWGVNSIYIYQKI